jgi:hypothetical protein
MNFDFIKEIFNRCIEIIAHPKEEWKRIKDEDLSLFQLFRDFLFPLITVSIITSMIGGMLRMSGVGFNSQVLLIEGLQEFLSLTISFSINILIINELMKTYGGVKNINMAANLVIYSSVPIILVSILLGLSTWLYIIGLFSLFVFYIFYHGTPVMLDLPEERQSNFSILSAMTILIIYLLISFIISTAFKTFY